MGRIALLVGILVALAAAVTFLKPKDDGTPDDPAAKTAKTDTGPTGDVTATKGGAGGTAKTDFPHGGKPLIHTLHLLRRYQMDKDKGDFEVNLTVEPFGFALPEEFVSSGKKEEWKNDAQISLNSGLKKGRTIEGVERFRFVLNDDATGLKGVFVKVKGAKESDGTPIVAAPKEVWAYLSFLPGAEDGSEMARNAWKTLHGKFGPPLTGTVRYSDTSGLIDPAIIK